MSLKLPRLTSRVAIQDKAASTAFQRFWDQFANAIETAFNGTESLTGSVASLTAGVAFRDEDNEFTGANSFDQPVESPNGFTVEGTQVVGAQVGGWTAGTGTPNMGAFDGDRTRVLTGSYVQVDMQAVQDDLLAARQRILALEQALEAHGLIGP